MNSLQYIVQQNNYAVQMMQQRAFGEAIKTLSVAVKKQKEGELEACPADSTMTLDQCMVQSQNCDTTCLHPTDGYLYRQGIYFSSVATPSYLLITPITLFNLALAHHLKAKEENLSAQQRVCLLKKALRLYEIGQSAQGRTACQNVLFAFATFNNIALIHQALGNHGLSKEFFEKMTSELMVRVDCGLGSQLECISGFLWNVSRERCPAAAA
eukprot:scaffold406_cov57-Cylindrotheca_fusiformis.AAC.19